MIGGLIGGAGAWAALTHLLPPPDAGAQLQSLRAEVEQLGAGVEGLQADRQAATELSGRVAALEQAPTTAGGELTARVEALETAGAASPESAQAGPPLAALEELQQQVTVLAGELAELATDVAGTGDAGAGSVALMQALQSRLAAVETSLPEAGASTALAERIDALGARVDALAPAGAKVEQLALDLPGIAERGQANQARLDQLAGQVQGLDELTGQVPGLGEQLRGLRGEVDGLTSQLTAAQSQAATAGDRRELAAALALITGQIDAALGRAQAYDAPLRSLAALGDQDEAVRQAAAELAPAAATGAPSLAALRQSFVPVAGEIVRREQGPEGESLIDQAASNLLGLVTVRPVGADVEGEGAAARVARAEAALAEGDVAAAVAELEALDGPPAEAAAGWLAQARSRLQATAALARLHARTTELLTPTN